MLKRIIGAGLGWTIGGPIGGILGWWLAGRLGGNTNTQRNFFEKPSVGHETTPSDFVVALLVLASCVMKADRNIKKQEVEFIKNFFLKHYEPEMVQEMMMFLKDIQSKEYSLEAVAGQINESMTEEEKIQIIHFLFGVSWADQEIHEKENEIIERIAVLIKLPHHLFLSIQNQYRYHHSSGKLEHSYRILDLNEDASIEDIKKTYRDLSMKYHPDKVAHLGEEVKKSSEEKFKIISEAYQKIKKAKNF